MYDKGHGVVQDYVRAHMWWNIAASQGDKDASRNLDRVVKKMTPTQLQSAQKLARECMKKNYKGCWENFPYETTAPPSHPPHYLSDFPYEKPERNHSAMSLFFKYR